MITLSKSQPIVARLPEELMEWIEEKVRKHDFANRSHGVVWCITQAMEREKEEKRKK